MDKIDFLAKGGPWSNSPKYATALQPRSVTIFNGGGAALNQEGPQDSVKFPKFEKFEGG